MFRKLKFRLLTVDDEIALHVEFQADRFTLLERFDDYVGVDTPHSGYAGAKPATVGVSNTSRTRRPAPNSARTAPIRSSPRSSANGSRCWPR